MAKRVTIIGAGTTVISAQDPGDSFYAPDTVQQVLTVNPATPALTLPTAGSINYGSSLSASTLTGGTNNINCSNSCGTVFTYR